jgi:four helix bundle protein
MHEKLICYRELLYLAGQMAKIMERWPRGYGYLTDQTERAISSSLLTLAEGNGKRVGTRERKRYFQISRGSIAEVMACLDLAYSFSLISREDHQIWRETLRANYYRIGRLP